LHDPRRRLLNGTPTRSFGLEIVCTWWRSKTESHFFFPVVEGLKSAGGLPHPLDDLLGDKNVITAFK